MRKVSFLLLLVLLVSQANAFKFWVFDNESKDSLVAVKDSLVAVKDSVLKLRKNVLSLDDSLVNISVSLFEKEQLNNMQREEIDSLRTAVSGVQSRIEVLKKDSVVQKNSAQKRKVLTKVRRVRVSPFMIRTDPQAPLTKREKIKVWHWMKKSPLLDTLTVLFTEQMNNEDFYPDTLYNDNILDIMSYGKSVNFPAGAWLDYNVLDLPGNPGLSVMAFRPVQLYNQYFRMGIIDTCGNVFVEQLYPPCLEKECPDCPPEKECPPKEPCPDCPEPEPQGPCRWPELYGWAGHYSSVDELKRDGTRTLLEKQGNFLGYKFSEYFGCGKENFGIGSIGNGWYWQTYTGESGGFNVSAGPTFSAIGEHFRFSLFAYYMFQGDWWLGHRSDEGAWSRQLSQFIYGGATYDAWWNDAKNWMEMWVNARGMVYAYKAASFEGVRENNPEEQNKSEVFFGARVFPFPPLGKLHFGPSLKYCYSIEDDKHQVMAGIVLDINYRTKIFVEWKGTYNSLWQHENGNSIGLIIDFDFLKTWHKRRESLTSQSEWVEDESFD